MNITELKELAEKAPKGRWDVGSYYIWRGDDRWHPVHVQKRGLMAETKTAAMSAWVAAANPAAILELIAQLEDAQGEIRALRATEAGLIERVKELEEGVRWYGEQSRLCRLVHSEGESGRNALSNDGGRKARALLEKKE